MMDKATLHYTLSTLAQTYAALAAFVFAVAIIRFQILREQRKEAEQIFRLYYYATPNPAGGWSTPQRFGPIVGPIEEIIRMIRAFPPNHPALPAVSRWEDLRRPLQRNRNALLVFEAWNLAVIAVSLIGFNYIDAWASCTRWIFWGLWGVILVTLVVSTYCLVIWTREWE